MTIPRRNDLIFGGITGFSVRLAGAELSDWRWWAAVIVIGAAYVLLREKPDGA